MRVISSFSIHETQKSNCNPSTVYNLSLKQKDIILNFMIFLKLKVYYKTCRKNVIFRTRYTNLDIFICKPRKNVSFWTGFTILDIFICKLRKNVSFRTGFTILYIFICKLRKNVTLSLRYDFLFTEILDKNRQWKPY